MNKKIKISVLWILMAVSLLVHGQLHFFEAGAVPKESEGILLFFSLCFFIPIAMAYLSLVLKRTPNRYLNLTVGSIFLLMNLYHLYGHISEPHQLPIVGGTVVIAILILWFSWNGQSRDLKEKDI